MTGSLPLLNLYLYVGTICLAHSPNSKDKFLPKCTKPHCTSFIPIHTHGHTFPLCASPVKYTIGTFLITVVSRENHVKCISFYLQLTKAGGEKRWGADCYPHGLPQALSWPAFLSGIVPASEMLFTLLLFLFFPHLSLTLEASKSKGRRKRRGRDWGQEGITDKNKGTLNSGSLWNKLARGEGFQQHERWVRRRIPGTSSPCGLARS